MPLSPSLSFILKASLFLFFFILALLFFLLAFKAASRLKARWLGWRRKLRRQTVHRLAEGIPGNYAELLAPRLWGDAQVVEELLIEVISKFKGKIRQEAVQLAEELDLVKRRLRQLRGRLSRDRIAYLIERLGLLRSSQATGELIPYLDHPGPEIPFVAARSLSRIADPAALVPLSKLFESLPANEVARYTTLLVPFGPAAAPCLLQILRHGQARPRRAAVTALSQIRNPQTAVPLLFIFRHDPDPEVRAAAVQALSLLGKASSEELALAIESEAESVRIAAANALGRLPGPIAVKALERVLHDKNLRVRVEAVRSLRLLGDPGMEVLKRHMKESDEELRILIQALLT